MITLEQFRKYCSTWSLTVVEAPSAPLDDAEEWPDTVAAGFHSDPGLGATACWLMTDGTAWAVTSFADGRKRLEDERTCLSDDEFLSGKLQHAT